MDDTQQSRVSDAAAAATRKRRSSILKSQRPARTPFSELEFNVATPTDTAKSRRVSFSKRTGVAEFVTNEATTTWKNFYEEHNKSLESSSNDSEANASRQPVGHLGKRLFDQQFEEVEAVDFMSGLANGSLNNVNFSQQLASLECTEGKLTAPNNKFELSAFTEQSKLFGNDFTAPALGENSGRIDVNFSAINQVEKDDLDEIEKDLERGSNNMGCHGPFSDRQNMSEYIEVDLNMTHVVKNDEDMSITDTVHSPVQDVSKSVSIDKKSSLNKDWVADKENIAINPYAAPCETNFAVNEEPDQVLVFDGKRLTLQPDKPEKDKNYRQTLLPNSSAETPQRKTIVLNVNDDLPNFADDIMLSSKCDNSGFSGFQEIKSNEEEISDTLQLSRVQHKPIGKMIHDNTGNISMTQALPTNIICQNVSISHDASQTKRRTIVFDKSTDDISMTEAVPAKFLGSSASVSERRRTVVYEDDTGNISITQAVPTNILVNENTDNTMKEVFDDDEDNILAAKALSSNLEDKPSKRKTIVFNDDDCNVSITQAVPSNLVLAEKRSQEKRRTIIYENDTGDISVTQAIPTNVILQNNDTNTERRRTVVYDDDTGDISVTQALPSNILLEKLQSDANKENKEAENISTTQPESNNITPKDSEPFRRRTIVYENDTGNISITQAIPAQLIPGYNEDKPIDTLNTTKKTKNRKRTTIVYDNDDGDISMTEAIPINIIKEAEAKNDRKTIVFDETEANISMTRAISTNVFLLDQLDSAVTVGQPEEPAEEAKEINEKVTNYEVYEEHPDVLLQDEQKTLADMSMTMAISKVPSLPEIEKGDLSVTKPIPAKLMTCTEVSDKMKDKLLELTEPDQLASGQTDVIVLQTSKTNFKPQISVSEQTEPRSIGDIYNDIFRDSEMRVESASFPPGDVTRAPVEKSSTSLEHPRVQQKVNKLSLVSTDWHIDNIAAGEADTLMQTDPEPKHESPINTELSLSVTTIDSCTADKSIMARVSSPSLNEYMKKGTDGAKSNESMFYVTKDNGDDAHTDKDVDSDDIKPERLTQRQLPLQQLEDNLEVVDELQKKLAELQTAVSLNQSKRLYDNVEIETPELEDAVDNDKDKLSDEYTYKKADDTQELLNMLSNLTDNVESDNGIEPGVVKAKGTVTTEHKRLSFAPSRQSIVLSREDLLSNISMAQAALQKSRLALDDSDSPEDDTKDVSEDVYNKSRRASNDVVKTLNFNDESISEDSLNNEYSPLKKTAFGESSYRHEAKGKVIPTYLKDVSDGIKELMLDLVKPINNENLPFETGVLDKGVPMVGSTQSTQIQANLATSSQIDVGSDSEHPADARMVTSNVCKNRSLRNPVRFSGPEVKRHKSKEKCAQAHSPAEKPSAVLIFDHQNPLNNVLLPPIDITEAHSYNPKRSNETLCAVEVTQTYSPMPPHSHSIGIHYNQTSREDTSRDFEVQTVTTRKQKATTRTGVTQKDTSMNSSRRKVSSKSSQTKVAKDKKKEPKRNQNASSRPLSLDQSVDAVLTKLKDDEVNTTIAMKQNKELLETSSSLTLVDDTLEGRTSPGLPEKEYSSHRIRFSRAHLIDMEKEAAEIDSEKFSEISLHDNYSSNSSANMSKGKKRIYSPATDRQRLNTRVEITPKPIAKMQKISTSPKVQIRTPMELSSAEDCDDMEPEKDVSSGETSRDNDRRSPKPRTAKTGQTVTVRQLIADCISFDTGFHPISDLEERNITGVLNPKSVSDAEPSHSEVSYTSSGDSKSVKCDTSTEKLEHSPPSSMVPSQVDWHPELMYSTSSSISDSDSGANVVAKIDMLPFMGTHECEWESSSSADTWLFRLLHGRLRLTVRLAHRLDNATRTRVRGDTAVLDIFVEAVQHDRKNSVAILCVRFACETMRQMVARTLRNKCFARDIPPLLRRCAAVVRVALRWGRAMHDAKLHLSYTMDTDGNLSLKPQVRFLSSSSSPSRRQTSTRKMRKRAEKSTRHHLARVLTRSAADNACNTGELPQSSLDVIGVANIPLRSVWEVTMRVQLVPDDTQALACPRATAVRVLPVVSDVVVPDADVQRVLDQTSKDWGHAPRTIWRVFRLLKHKKRDDDIL